MAEFTTVRLDLAVTLGIIPFSTILAVGACLLRRALAPILDFDSVTESGDFKAIQPKRIFTF